MQEPAFDTDEDLIDKVFWTDMKKGVQYRFSISEFYDQRYFGIRKWVQVYDPDEDCGWIPTREGFVMPYELSTTSALWNAFTAILSEAEVLQKVAEYGQKPGSTDST